MSPFLALFAWPLVSGALIARLRVPVAILVVILGGYLLLPEQTAIDLPMLPALNKHTIPALSIFIFILLMGNRFATVHALPGLLPKSLVAKALILLVVAGAFFTAMTNQDRIVTELTSQPALRPYDAFSMALTAAMMLLPLILARKYFASGDMHRLILVGLCIAALAYSFLALYEVRMSPQLNLSIYGFFPHSFAQHRRGDGFRPIVFLEHGLLVAIFMCMAILASAGLAKLKNSPKWALFLACWLLVTLILSKSLGALVIAVILLPIILMLNVRAQFLVAAIFGGLLLCYPILRGAQVIPTDKVLALATSIDEKRAGSLRTRFVNEDLMLARAEQRPVFGWGGWGRSRVRDQLGRDVSTADGYWVIIIGVGGWVRYLGEFGLLTAPFFLMFILRRRKGLGRETSVLAIVVVANLIDAIPNAGITPITWFLVGALWGRLEVGAETVSGEESGDKLERAPPSYARRIGPIHERNNS